MIQVDRHTIIQVLGCLMKKPNLLSDVDKYCLEPMDFNNPLDKYIFGSIYNLYVNGAEKISTVDIDNYLKDNDAAQVLMKKENGLAFIQDCEFNVNEQSFDYYYNKFKKINLLRDIQKTGRNTEQIYCEDMFNPKKQEINDRFEEMKLSDLVDILKTEVNVLEKKYVINNKVEESLAADGIRDLIKDLKEEPEVGCRLQGDIFNTICRGGRKGKLYLRSAGTSVGKALPNYTKIPTPNGWTTVGEVKVGDYLFDRFGNPTKVLAIYPQKEKKQIYKVYFKSGKVAECCDEHLWSYYSNKNDKHSNKLITTTLRELIENPKGLKDNQNMCRWSVPAPEPVNYKERQYSVDPYVMGLILGDGGFRYDQKQKGFYFSSSDEELVKAIKDIMDYKLYKKNSEKNYNWGFELKEGSHKNVWVEDILKDYPELWQAKSETKFIPKEYLFGSIEQRFNLLAGLLDTDGSISERGDIHFSTVSPYIRDGIIELCEGLGMFCKYKIDKRAEKYTTGECYNIYIQAKKAIKPKMFRLKRKVERAITYANNGKKEFKKDRDSIINIEATDKFAEMTCFYVDNEEHLFLMNNFIVTHNTRSMVGDACEIAYPIKFDTKYGKWVSTGSCEKVLYIMTEQDPEEIKTMILAHLTGYNEDMFLYGTYTEQHMPRIEKAIEIMEKYKDNMLFARIPDPCSSVIKNLFRRYSLQEKVENFFYDYIFSSPAMLNEYRDLKIAEHVALRLFTTSIKNLAIELNAFILTSTQISGDDDPKGGFRDYHHIRGARAIADLVDFGCIMSRPTSDELNLVEGFSKAFDYRPNLITDVFKNRRGRWTMVRIWSCQDLGTCTKKDIFVTDANNKPVENFHVVDFNKKDKFFEDLEKFYNDGELTELTEKLVIEQSEVNNILEDIEEAFGGVEEQKKRLKDIDLESLL